MTLKTKLKHAQEMFVLLVVEQELNATEAYRRCYPRAKSGAVASGASRLLKNANVLARMAEIKAEQALVVRAATRVTAVSISENLREVAEAAKAKMQFAAATQAYLGIAKLHGLLVDKHQVDAIVRRPSSDPHSPDSMSHDQWLQEFNPTALIIDAQPTVVTTDEGESDEALVEVAAGCNTE